jgi:flagellar protein FliO/FliZ
MANVSVAALLGRLVVSLGVVIGLMAVIAKVARGRLGHGPGRVPAEVLQLQVLARQSIGKNASVLVVRSGDRALLLGVTDGGVSLLREMELPPEAEPAASPRRAMFRAPAPRTTPGAPWGALLERARELTLRRV